MNPLTRWFKSYPKYAYIADRGVDGSKVPITDLGSELYDNQANSLNMPRLNT